MALTPAGLDPVQPQVLHPLLTLPSLIRCQPEKKGFIRRGLVLALWTCPRTPISKLGQGGMGEVYLAENSRLDRKVALKILPEHLSDRAELRERFEREARAVSSLNHPHICTLYDIGEQDGIHIAVGVRTLEQGGSVECL